MQTAPIWWIRTYSAGNKDGMRQTDEKLAVSECLRSKVAAGGTIVEPTLGGGRHGR